MIDWKSDPKISGEIAVQSKAQHSKSCSRVVLVKNAPLSCSENTSPFTYGKAARMGGALLLLFSVGVLSVSNS
jgi:hypothetical protein